MADIDNFAHNIAEEIYKHIEKDHVKDDFITWFDLALLTVALVLMNLIPESSAAMTIMPNVAVKGYQIARRYRRQR